MTMQPQDRLDLLTPKQVRKILQCSLSMVYKLADKGLIGCVRIPTDSGHRGRGLVRFKLEEHVLQFINGNESKAIHDT